ncbi:hypothetical protein HAX54_004278, partial [Datura stramonium]|nr:hypothetical protein [Datura stramonium]
MSMSETSFSDTYKQPSVRENPMTRVSDQSVKKEYMKEKGEPRGKEKKHLKTLRKLVP